MYMKGLFMHPSLGPKTQFELMTFAQLEAEVS